VKKKVPRSAGFYIVIALLALLVASQMLNRGEATKKLAFSEFTGLIDKNQVKNVRINVRSNTVSGELVKAVKEGEPTKFNLSYPQGYEEKLTQQLLERKVKTDTNAEQPNVWLSILFQFLPIIVLFGLFMWLMNSMQGGGNRIMQFGKSRAKLQSKDAPKVTFADVAGADEAIEELREIKEFLENPAKFAAIGAKIPKGVLLYGPPGTGKTLLAKAVAGEAGVPFFSISGSDFVEMFVGVGASRVRDLFEQAKANAPAIIFVDEIDAVGRHRGAGMGGGHDEREQTLNQMLVEMDGFEVRTGVIMIAATNRPDILDPALLRPGRFDRQISVDLPDLEGRKAVYRVHAKGKPLGPDVDLDVIARGTPGMSGADIANLLNEAALIAARRNKSIINQSEMEAAADRVMMGAEKKSRVMPEHELRNTAYHEAGHALVGHVLEGCDPIHKVTIIPRGRALGVTISLPTEDRYSRTRSGLRDLLGMLLGGRTAEELVFGVGNVTTGASNDLERASDIARSMVTKYGFSDQVGLLSLGQANSEVFLGRDFGSQINYSAETAAKIDDEMRNLLDHAHATALGILTTHREVLNAFAELLLKKETLEKPDIDELFKDLPKWQDNADEPKATRKPAPIDPPTVGADEPELVGAARRTGALGKVRNRAGRAWQGAKDGLRGDDDGTPPPAPSGTRPRVPRPQLGAGPSA
jgi:cell division protease FtsH